MPRSRALQNVSRRQMLQAGLVIGGGVTAASLAGAPSAIEQAVYGAAKENVRANATVGMIQLVGGNDGLGMVVPLSAGLADRRGQASADLIANAMPLHDARTGAVSRDFGLHPSLPNLARRFAAGQVAILPAVGYPLMSKSHAIATQIWQRADPTQRELTGAFGRLADLVDDGGHPLEVAGIGAPGASGLVRAGRARPAVLPADAASYAFTGGVEAAVAALWRGDMGGPLGAALTGLMAQASATATRAHPLASAYRPQATYPAGELASGLSTAAALIKGGAGLSAFSLAMEGFDTHSAQATRQAALLAELDLALNAFLDDCAAAGRSPVVAVYSEFGRTVAMNSVGGTDHGSATTVLVVGKPVRGGVYGERPDLAGADVPYQTDFRAVYATLIEHLGVDPQMVVGGFPTLGFLPAGV